MTSNSPNAVIISVIGPHQHARLEAANPGDPAPVLQTGQALVGKLIQMTSSGIFGFVVDSSVVIDGHHYWVHWFNEIGNTFIKANNNAIHLDDPNTFKIPARKDVPLCHGTYVGTRVTMSRQDLNLPAVDPPRFQEVTFFLIRNMNDLLYICIFMRPADMTVEEFNIIHNGVHQIDSARLQ